MNDKVLSALFAFLTLIGCNKLNNWENCEGFQTMEGVNFYHNNIDDALECSALTRKPILIHFTDWRTSQRTFYDKLVANPSINHLLQTDFILLDLMCDDKEIISKVNSSLSLAEFGLCDYSTIGEANSILKAHLISGKKKANPQYVLVNHDFKKIGDEWGYTNNAKEFLEKLRSAVGASIK